MAMNVALPSSAGGSTGSGIVTEIRAFVKQCSATRNRADGISVGRDSVAIGNRTSFNGQGGAAAGIRAAPSGSRIEENHARDNTGTGITASNADVVIRNSAGNNSVANYRDGSGAALSGPNIGPIGTVATTTHPAANLQ